MTAYRQIINYGIAQELLIGGNKNVIDLVDPVSLEALAHIFGNVRCYLDTIYGTLDYSFFHKQKCSFLFVISFVHLYLQKSAAVTTPLFSRFGSLLFFGSFLFCHFFKSLICPVNHTLNNLANLFLRRFGQICFIFLKLFLSET